MTSSPPEKGWVIRGGRKPKPSPDHKPAGHSETMFVAPQEEWTEEDWELARLILQVIEEEKAAGKKMLRML